MTSPAKLEPASAPARDLVGSTVAGKYSIKRRIGAGGMGAVYEGEHIEIGKRVAIKVIESEHAQSEQLAARFRREARAASAVESEHIVQVFDVGQDDVAGLYMVMEYLTGEDLAVRLEQQGGKIPLEEGATIVAQAARGLAKAHAAGVVHRDLKPANIFLTKREDQSTCVKVVDFGISKLQRPDTAGKPQTLTREGSVVGTPVYMSPEQAQGMTVDARTDVWSLGALAYEVLAGRPPYDLLDTYELMIIQIVTKKIPSLAEIAPWIPAEVRTVIEGALQHDLALRTPDAATFARDLVEAAQIGSFVPISSARIVMSLPDPASASALGATVPGEPSSGRMVHASTQPAIEPNAKRRRSTVLVATILALAGLAAVLMAFAFVRSSRSHQDAAPSPPAEKNTAAAVALTPPASVAVTSALPEASAGRTASSAASAAPVESTPRATRPTPAPRPRPPATGAPPAQTAKGTGQYGAAGVATSY